MIRYIRPETNRFRKTDGQYFTASVFFVSYVLKYSQHNR